MSHVFRFLGRRLAPGTWELLPEDSDHALKILRFGIGQPVEVTDGEGVWAVGTITSTSKLVQVLATVEHDESAPVDRLTIAIGALRFRMLDDVLPALVELGVDTIAVIQQAGTESERTGVKVQARWRRIVSEAVKQSKRSWAPELAIFPSLEAFIEGQPTEGTRLVADPDGLLSMAQAPLRGAVICAIGGEQGFSIDELRVLTANGFVPTRLATPVLRAATAAIAACAVIAARRL